MLSASDRKALKDGFKYVVITGGVRKCYCTTAGEAKREAGRYGKVKPLSNFAYVSNPSKAGRRRNPWGDSDRIYQIVRFYREAGKRSRVIEKGLTLEEAQAHCKNPKTRKAGVWFDGYEKMPVKSSLRRNPGKPGRPPKTFEYKDSVSGEQMTFGAADYTRVAAPNLKKLKRLARGKSITITQHKVMAKVTRKNPRTTYAVLVGNVGTVYQGTNKAEAKKVYNEYVKASKSGIGRAGNEDVRLLNNYTGDIFNEYYPKPSGQKRNPAYAVYKWDYEITDTFGGEANYSWVNRGQLVASEQGAINIVRAKMGLTGKRAEVSYYGDTIEIRPKGRNAPCIVGFINWVE